MKEIECEATGSQLFTVTMHAVIMETSTDYLIDYHRVWIICIYHVAYVGNLQTQYWQWAHNKYILK